MDDDESFNTNNETEECVNVKIHIEDSVDDDHDEIPIDEDAESFKKTYIRRKRRFKEFIRENNAKRPIFSDDNLSDKQFGRFIKISDDEEDDDDEDEDNEGSASEANNDDGNPPKLVPAPLLTLHSSTVKTASVTSVTKNMSNEWSHDHSYDSGISDKRQLLGRTSLETLKSVSSFPQKAAAFLEQFTAAPYSEDEQVRCDVLEYIPHMALLLSEDSNNHQLKSLISTHLLPTVSAGLSDHSTQVVKVAESALLTMLEHCLIGSEQIETKIWPVIKGRMHNTPSMENTIGVLNVMSKMAPWLGCDQTERLLVPTLEQLSSHSELAVRRVCASLYGDFCAVISTVKTETVLVPSFLRLCADSEYVVRKTCAEAFMSVSCTVTLHTRRTQLAPIFARLLSDPVRWVQLAAFQSLGPFITTFAEPSITMLSYNHLGELVLKHPDGFEFRLNSCKVDERYLYTRESFFALVMDNNQPQQQQQYSQQFPQKLYSQGSPGGEYNSVTSPHVDKRFQQNRQHEQADDRNNNLDRLSNHRRYSNEENTSDDIRTVILDDNCSYSDETNDIDSSYNQFQYWRDPLPSIDGDLNSNVSIITIPVNTTNNNNNNNSSQTVTVNQRLLQQQNVDEQCQQQLRTMTTLVNKFQDMNVNEATSVPYESCNSSDASSASETPSENEKIQSPIPSLPATPTLQSPGSPTPSLQDIVPVELIRHFVSMSEPGRDAGEDLAGHCAYNLPAVALTLGPKHWDLLKPAYETLAADRQWKVRRIVASSIHELAVIVGEEVATQDLVPVFNGFIKDLDEVRIAALKHLAHFLKLLRPAGRNSFLPRLTEFLMTDYEWNWRFRQELAEQLLQVLGLFSPVDTCHHLSPVVIALLVDRVSDVRKVALQLATELVSHVSIDVTLLRSLLAELAQQFAHSSRWNRRQTFALFCSRLVSEGVLSGEMFARDVLPHLLDLSWDRVPNVRLTVARALANDVIIQPYFSDFTSPHYEVLHSVLKRLQGDKDRDVRYFASQVPVMHQPFPVDIQHRYSSVSTNDEDSSPDGDKSGSILNRSHSSH